MCQERGATAELFLPGRMRGNYQGQAGWEASHQTIDSVTASAVRGMLGTLRAPEVQVGKQVPGTVSSQNPQVQESQRYLLSKDKSTEPSPGRINGGF